MAQIFRALCVVAVLYAAIRYYLAEPTSVHEGSAEVWSGAEADPGGGTRLDSIRERVAASIESGPDRIDRAL